MENGQTDKIVELDGATRPAISSDRVLQNALDAGVQDVVVIGRAPDDSLWCESASVDAGDVLWLLEKTKQHLLDTMDMPSAEPGDGERP